MKQTEIFTNSPQYKMSIEFFRIEFYRIYRICRICRKLFLVVLKIIITKNNFLQMFQILSNTIFSHFEKENG